MPDYKEIAGRQHRFWLAHETLSYEFRIKQLNKLRTILIKHETAIADAVKEDLQKPYFEALFIDVWLVIEELDHIISNLKKWMRTKKVHSPFPLLWPGKSEIHSMSYGTVLIISPWNFPFLLCLSPLLGALAAGNCAVLKPSEHAPHTQKIIADLINSNFPSEYLYAVAGGVEETKQLLKQKFNYLFFTGSTSIGKEIMLAAAQHLTPFTLELGGKSPCIVDETADLNYAARKIIWAKMNNAGQVCIAPDYLFIKKQIKPKLIEAMILAVQTMYGPDTKASSSYARIINLKHFKRLKNLLSLGRIIYGGEHDETQLYLAPTLMDEVALDSELMQEEIFGPILPILTYENLDEVVAFINDRPTPLSLYLFSEHKISRELIIEKTAFGGGCINDCMMHIANYNLPFGGMGSSGIGKYHGRFSFETFSHQKSVYYKNKFFDFKFQYPPYTSRKIFWLKKLMGR